MGKARKKKEDREGKRMMTAAQYLMQESELTLSMRDYVKELNAEGPDVSPQARQEALEALRRMGVVDEAGERKEKIVSWE